MVRDRTFLRLVILALILILSTSSTSGLSCFQVTPDSLTIHCPEKNSCDSNLKASDSNMLEVYLGAERIPDPGQNILKNITEPDTRDPVVKTTLNRSLPSANEYLEIRTTLNRSLPSANEYLENAKTLCPSPRNIHAYPKSEFNKNELQDTAKCYTTRIDEQENYFLVRREGTTKGLQCVEKVTGERVIGGETHYAAPIDRKWMIESISDWIKTFTVWLWIEIFTFGLIP